MYAVAASVCQPDQFAALKADLAAQGIGIRQSGTFFDAVDYYQLDTRDALSNVIVEVHCPRRPDWQSAIKPDEVLHMDLKHLGPQFLPTQKMLHIGVVCEAVNPLDMPGFLVNTPEQLDRLLRDVDHPNLQAQYDLYHMARQGVDMAAGIRLLAGRIGHVQFADVPGRGEPGSGQVDFEPALRALQEDDYPGWLGAEYKPSGVTADSLGWLPVWKARWA